MKNLIKILLIAFAGVLLIIADWSCKDTLPPKLNPYESLRTDWRFDPSGLKTSTLETSVAVQPITIMPYLVNGWDEWIVDTNFVQLDVKITLMNNPEISQTYSFSDTSEIPRSLRPGDSTWVSFDWRQRLQGETVYRHLPAPTPNHELNRLEWEVARIRLEGTIQVFRNVLPTPLPPKEIHIFYWQKMN